MGDWEDTAKPRRARPVVCALLALAFLFTAPISHATGTSGGEPEPSQIDLRKSAGPVTALPDGQYSVPILIQLENLGSRPLANVQVSDDLARELAPASPIGITGLRVEGGLQQINENYDGTSVITLLAGTETLEAGTGASIHFDLRFSANGQPGPFFNLAKAVAKDLAKGKSVSACSRPPLADPDIKSGRGCKPTKINIPPQPPLIGMAKAAAEAEWLGDGWFRSRMTFIARNYGGEKALNVQIFDDLGMTFRDAAEFQVEALASSWPVNSSFDGVADTRLLAPGAFLFADESLSVELTVRFRPTADIRQQILNMACAGAEGGPCDQSYDGQDPDPDGDDDPKEQKKTLIFDPKPIIGAANDASPVRYPGGREVQFDLTVTLSNLGNTPLSEISAENALGAMFADAVNSYSVIPGSITSDGLPINERFDGSAELNLLGADAALAQEETSTISLSVTFEPVEDEGTFENQTVTRTAQGAQDTSTDGLEPDPDRNGVPSEREPTLIAYKLPRPPISRIGLAKDATQCTKTSTGARQVQLDFYLENTGEVSLTGLDLVDDLRRTFPAPATFRVIPGSLTSSELLVNSGFNGAADSRILAGGNSLEPGQRASASVLVEYQPNDRSGFTNQATISTNEGAEALSAPGTDPNAADSAATDICPDPTDPEITVDKSLVDDLIPVPDAEETWDARFRIIVRNSGDSRLDNVQIMDDLRETFPAPTTFEVVGSVSVSGDLSEENPGFGRGTFALLSGSESLEIGEAATVEFTARFGVNDDTEVYFNEILASAIDPEGTRVYATDDEPTRIEVPGSLRGRIFLDVDHDRVFTSGVDETLNNWGIELIEGELDAASFRDDRTIDPDTTSDGDNGGTYSITAIRPSRYAVLFRHPETQVAWQLVPIVIEPRGEAVVDLPIDPQGVVYDAVTRKRVARARLSIQTAEGADLPRECLLPQQQGQEVGSLGRYRFSIRHGQDDACPEESREYRLVISGVPEPDPEDPDAVEYRLGESELLPPVDDVFDALSDCPGNDLPCLIETNNNPPEGDEPRYYTAFRTAPRGALEAPVVVNNHIPIDPVSLPPPPPPETDSQGLSLQKSANRRRVTVGGVVGYRLRLANLASIPLPVVNVTDAPPPGFQIQNDSGQLLRAGADGILGTRDDVKTDLPITGTGPVSFAPISFEIDERLEIRYVSRVSPAVREGSHVNTATASYRYGERTFEVSDDATVQVMADPLFTRATVIGKVFHDADGNGVQSRGEIGMHKVRLLTPEGLIVETDEEGRYHIADIDVTRSYGANYVIKLDTNTLPSGWQSLSDTRQIVHLAPGGIGKVNWAVDNTRDQDKGDDCCGEYLNFRYFDPFATEKRLDVYPSRITKNASDWTLEFSLSSNYYMQAPLYELTITGENDVSFTDPDRKRLCGLLEHPQQFVRMSRLGLQSGRQYSYRLRVYEMGAAERKRHQDELQRSTHGTEPQHLDCRTIEDVPSRPFDTTHSLSFHLPENPQLTSWAGRRGMSPGSALDREGIVLGPRVQGRAVRRYEKSRDPVEVHWKSNDRLLNSNEQLVMDMRGDPEWEVLPKKNAAPEPLPSTVAPDQPRDNLIGQRELPSRIEMEVKFEESRRAADNSPVGRTWLNRDSLHQPHDVVYGATGMETAMLCCDLETAVETVADQDNNIYAIRVHNRSHEPIEPAFEVQGSCPWTAPDSAQIEPRTTREFYLGGFHQEGPWARSCWRYISVRISSPLLPRGPDGPMIKYVISRHRYEENGPWRPPRTTAHCLDVEGTPQVTEQRQVAAIRVEDEDPNREEGVIAEDLFRPNNDYGVAVVDLTIGGRSLSGGLEDLSADLDGSFADGRVAAYWRGERILGSTGDHEQNEDDQRDLAKENQELDTLSWVLQIDSTKDDLDNLFDNLKRKDPDRIFRQLDTDQYYPTYGDDSTTILDTATQGAFYARVAANRSHALWGNFNTGLTGTEFAQYNRSLYGAYGDYQSKARTPQGESRWQLSGFHSEAQTTSGSASYLATGGSLYYLPHTDIVMGSEKVWVEVRRRDTEQVEEREILLPGRDYEVDPLQGRILLQAPLAQVVRERFANVIRSRALEGDDIFLFVDYEYLTPAFEAEDHNWGLRGKAWVHDAVSLGFTHVTDEQATNDYQLNGLDAIWRHGEDSYLSAEFARSEAERGGSSKFSLDGGLTFEESAASSEPAGSEGEALGFEARLNLEDVSEHNGSVHAWWKQRDAGFDADRFRAGTETTDLGLNFATDLLAGWSLSGGATELDRDQDRRSRTARLQASGSAGCKRPGRKGRRGCAEFDLEARYEDLSLDDNASSLLPYRQEDGSATLLGARAGYWIDEATNIYASAQTALSSERDYEDNDLIAVGTNTRFSDKLALSLEAADGDRGEALIAGADYRMSDRASFNLSGGVGAGALSRFSGRYQLTEGHELFGTYTMDPDRTDGARNLLSVGQRRDLGNRMRIFTESQFGRGFGELSNGHLGGIELDHDRWVLSTTLQASSVERSEATFDRLAASIGAAYRSESTTLSTRFELREDEGDDLKTRQYVSSNALAHQLSEAGRLLGKVNVAWTDDRYADREAGRFAEIALGYAHRPIDNDTWNGMVRYNYLYDVGTEGQSNAPGDEKAHVVSAEGFVDVHEKLQLGAKLSYRGGKTRIEKGTGDWYDLSMGMAVARASYRINLEKLHKGTRLLPDQVELLGEYRWLEDFEGNSTQRGALLGIYRNFDPRLRAEPEEQRAITTGAKRLLEPTMRVGIGYNFSGFDDDMRQDNYKSHGWFLDMMAVF